MHVAFVRTETRYSALRAECPQSHALSVLCTEACDEDCLSTQTRLGGTRRPSDPGTGRHATRARRASVRTLVLGPARRGDAEHRLRASSAGACKSSFYAWKFCGEDCRVRRRGS